MRSDGGVMRYKILLSGVMFGAVVTLMVVYLTSKVSSPAGWVEFTRINGIAYFYHSDTVQNHSKGFARVWIREGDGSPVLYEIRDDYFIRTLEDRSGRTREDFRYIHPDSFGVKLIKVIFK